MTPADSPDTIVARATPAGRGGLAVLRISGPAVRALAAPLLGSLPEPRRAALRDFRDEHGEPLDRGIAVFFAAPDSYTGEDVLELHVHGSPVLCELLVERVLALGARLARPGEFTERAFLNDKIDLAQAEAVADLIDAGSRAAARAAQRSLRGEFSSAVLELADAVASVRVQVEAAIDFPDEDVDFLADAELAAAFEALEPALRRLESAARQGRVLRDGLHVVIAGPPNAGKSSLLNALAGHAAAIVAPVPGTTRDLVREDVELEGLALRLVDTAGLRSAADAIEEEGIRRARAELAVADHVLLVAEADAPPATAAALVAEVPEGVGYTVVLNKCDLAGVEAGPVPGEPRAVRVSALTGAGLAGLHERLRNAAGLGPAGEGAFTARARHVESIGRARAHFDLARQRLADGAGELVAEELLQVQNALAGIVGEFGTEELLSRIFSSFCIGK